MDESKKIQDRIKDINAVENDNNERVIFICPGCDMTKNNAEKKTSCCNCRVFCRKLTKKVKIFILSAPGLTILLLSYLMIGAVAFNVLEGGRKWSQSYNFTKSTTGSHKDDKIKESVERLWKITENLNVLYKDNWTKLAGEEITHLQDYFFEELTIKNDNSAMSECHTKNYQSYRKRNPPFWNLGECFLYSLSLLTTVGSGNILPRTVWGRVFSMLYITIGFFIMLVYLAVVGDYLANPFRRFYTFISCNNATKKTASKSVTKCSVPNCNKTTTVYHDQSSSIPVWLAALVLITYITSGALTFNLIEKWTILDSWYFCFMSLVTIGFGGFTPGRMESISMIATSAYILIGMALLSMCFNLIQTDVVLFFRNLYLWSEREDAMNLLSLTRSMPS